MKHELIGRKSHENLLRFKFLRGVPYQQHCVYLNLQIILNLHSIQTLKRMQDLGILSIKTIKTLENPKKNT